MIVTLFNAVTPSGSRDNAGNLGETLFCFSEWLTVHYPNTTVDLSSKFEREWTNEDWQKISKVLPSDYPAEFQAAVNALRAQVNLHQTIIP
jgi:hypothetical protein